MGHNKMYREIEGYEDALYLTSDIKDELEELYHMIQHGAESAVIEININKVNDLLIQVKNKVAPSK